MAQVLPATIEALNMQQQTLESPTTILKKSAFEGIQIEKRYKREVSLPNGVENWNISNFESYLNFDDNVIGNTFDVLASPDDRMVPETEQRDRCSSISSVSSSSFIDEKQPIFHNFGVKTMSIKNMGSGSTCISSDHSYFNSNVTLQKALDPEETYQNLDMFLHVQEVPEMTDTLSSSPPPFSPMASTSSNDSSFDILHTETSSCSFSSALLGSSGLKRPLDSISEDDVFMVKQTKIEFIEPSENSVSSRHQQDGHKKTNTASKNCRKTRKEKQKEMEQRVSELEQEKENLRVQVQLLEQLIQAHKQCLLNAIAQKR